MTVTIHSVLLVDDDPAANFLHRLAIKSSGRVEKILDATSGADALAYLQRAQTGEIRIPDLLLLDINMPGMSGWQLLDVCAQEAVPLPCVVSMLTTSENPDDRQRAATHPAVADFLTKFMETADFERLLDRHHRRT